MVHVRVTVSEMAGGTEIHTTTVPPNLGDGAAGGGRRAALRVPLEGYEVGSRLDRGVFRKVLVVSGTALLVMVEVRVAISVTVVSWGCL